MRILLDQAVYDMRNKGNVALLQATILRFKKRWPQASLEVMTAAPHLLKIYCPEAHPVSADGRHNWSLNRDQLEKIHRFMPKQAMRWLFELREEVWHRWPHLTPGQLRHQFSAWLSLTKTTPEAGSLNPEAPRTSDPEHSVVKEADGPDLQQAMAGADLVVATGGGFMCDSDKPRAIDVLNRLERAIQLGKRTAMVGQGIGPIEDPALQAKCKAILPAVDVILVRENKIALPLLKSLGIEASRVMMTGDDAVELAYEARPDRLGDAIGVSLRMAHYTAVEPCHLDRVRVALHQSAAKYGATLKALPISCDGYEADQKKINLLLNGYHKTSTVWQRFDPPIEVIKQAGQCRVVVAGAFHAAVFALAQGIPVVGLVKTLEYRNKFSGLADQFGSVCQLLSLEDEALPQKLTTAIDTAWESADRMRSQILKAATAQIALGQAGYQRLYDLIEGKTERGQR